MNATGWTLYSVVEHITRLGILREDITSYVFLSIPSNNVLEQVDRPLIEPDYFSLRELKLKLPWYVARKSSSNAASVSHRNDKFNLIKTPERFMGRNLPMKLSMDLHHLNEPIYSETSKIALLLADYIKSESSMFEHFNVVVSGPGAIGKSALCRALCLNLGELATYLPLDSSIMDTRTRDRSNLDGYQLESYNLEQVKEWLNLIEDEKSFSVSPYDHSKRKCIGEINVKGSAKIRLIDWVFALHSKTGVKGDIKIVLDASDEVRREYLVYRTLEIRKKELSKQTIECI